MLDRRRPLTIEMPVVRSKMPKPTNKAWTAKEIELLKEAWCNSDIQMRYIPGIVGHSKNACIGKAHRLKLPTRRVPKLGLIPINRKRRTVAQLTGDISHNMPPAGGDWQLVDAKTVQMTSRAIPAPEATLAPCAGSLFKAPIEPVPPKPATPARAKSEAIATGPEAIATPAKPAPEPKPYAGSLFADVIEPVGDLVSDQAGLAWSGPGVRYLDLKEHHCRAFVGEGLAGDGVYWSAPISCGTQVKKGTSYCASHGRLYFNPNVKRWR